MASPQRQETVTSTRRAGGPTQERSIVLVAGSGRSGTSVFAGVLQRLGFHVPQPEVPPDETNPRGFAESRWVVDFHTRLLQRAGVQTADARPAAWAHAAEVALDEKVRLQLESWLAGQFREADHIVIKDPRLSWFVPLWRRCAEDVGAAPRFATMLRHPAAVVDSKQRSYGTWRGAAARAAGWLNQALYTERATRDAPRAFVRFDELVDDWAQTLARVGDALDLAVIADAPWAAMVRVQQFLDPSLARSRPSWDPLEIPAPLREQADEVWELLCRLADGEDGGVLERLDAARAAYVELYEGAEAIARSSILAARRSPRTRTGERVSPGLRRVVPRRLRQKVPRSWRRAVVRILGERA
jgi:hypothetical protein